MRRLLMSFFLMCCVSACNAAAWKPGTYAPMKGIKGARSNTCNVVVPWRAEYAVDGMTSKVWATEPNYYQFAWAMQCTLSYDQIIQILAWEPSSLTAVDVKGYGTDKSANCFWVIGHAALNYTDLYHVDGTDVYFLQAPLATSGIAGYDKSDPLYSFVFAKGITFSLGEGYGCFYLESYFSAAYKADVVSSTVASVQSFMASVAKYFDFYEVPAGLAFHQVFGGGFQTNSLVDYSGILGTSIPNVDVWRSGRAFDMQQRMVPVSAQAGVYSGSTPLSRFLWRRFSPTTTDHGSPVADSLSESQSVSLGGTKSTEPTSTVPSGGVDDSDPEGRRLAEIKLLRLKYGAGAMADLGSARLDGMGKQNYAQAVMNNRAQIAADEVPTVNPGAALRQIDSVDRTAFGSEGTIGVLGWNVQDNESDKLYPMNSRHFISTLDAQRRSFLNVFLLNDPRLPWVTSQKHTDPLYSGTVRSVIPFKEVAVMTESSINQLAQVSANASANTGVAVQHKYAMFPLQTLGFVDMENEVSLRLPSGYYPKFVGAHAFEMDSVPIGVSLPKITTNIPSPVSVSVPAMGMYSKVTGGQSLADFTVLEVVDNGSSGVTVQASNSKDSSKVSDPKFSEAVNEAFGVLDYAGSRFNTIDLFILQNVLLINETNGFGLSIHYSSSRQTPLMLHSGGSFGIPAAFPAGAKGGYVLPRTCLTESFRLTMVSDSTVYVRGSVGVFNDVLYQNAAANPILFSVLPNNATDPVLWYLPVEVTPDAKAKGFVEVVYRAKVPQSFSDSVSAGGNGTSPTDYFLWTGNKVASNPHGGGFNSSGWGFVSVFGGPRHGGMSSWNSIYEATFRAPVLTGQPLIMVPLSLPWCTQLTLPVQGTPVGRALGNPIRTFTLSGNWKQSSADARIQIVAPDFLVVPKNYGGYW